MNSTDICPCNGCVPPERQLGCHATCGKYITWNARHQRELEALRKARNDAEMCFPPHLRKHKKRRNHYGSNSFDGD